MQSTAPELSDQMRWVETGGEEGTPPLLESVLIRDYGPVLRYDFGGTNEAYLHFMQISGAYNYRWGDGGGVLYYGAKNKTWSYNGKEDNGDRFDIDFVTAFSAGGKGLGRHSTDQPLYDFDGVQFYRALADPAVADRTKYRARGMMMVRDDYTVLYDEVDDETVGQFTWVTAEDFPAIYQLKPGASFEEEATEEVSVRRYRGQGDFLTVVAPDPLSVEARPFGAVVNDTEYIFTRSASC